MLNPESRKRAEKLLENITLEIQGHLTFDISLGDIQWLAKTLVEMDDRYSEHKDCCFPDRSSCAYRKRIGDESDK